MKVSKGQEVPQNQPSELQRKLGETIKAERLRLGITQEELAWRADVHRTYLADIERGGRNLTLRSIANLARALQVSVEELLSNSSATKSIDRKRFALEEILLVEGNAADVELTQLAFKCANISNPVKVVNNGREALDYLDSAGRYKKRHAGLPQLVLLDLNLPDMSGVEVLRVIKAHKRTHQIPVVVLTAFRQDKIIIECSRLGAANYIIKPFGFDDFSKVTPKLNLHWMLVKLRGRPEKI